MSKDTMLRDYVSALWLIKPPDITPNPPGSTKTTERLDEGTKEIEE